MSDTTKTVRGSDLESDFTLFSGKLYEFVMGVFQCHVLEVEETHFHSDSAVLLPDYEEDDDGKSDEKKAKITSFTLIAACYNQIQANPAQKFLITGHTDTTAGNAYNLKLSDLRARNTFAMIKGDRDDWASICDERHKKEDYQLILKWLSRDWGWDCDPGKIDNHDTPATKSAITKFKIRYNKDFSASIGTDPVVDKAAWAAFFDLYELELMEQLGVDRPGLISARDAMKPVTKCPSVAGCGESFPKEKPGVDNFKSKKNRRVEILFFDEGEEPELPCHAEAGKCAPKKCDLHDKSCYAHNPIPVSPGLPHALRMPVFLRLTYKDPTGADRDFPEGFPVVVEYDTGDRLPSGPVKTGKSGRLHFDADRTKASFTLKFEFPDADLKYIAAGKDASQPDMMVARADADAQAKAGYRMFRMPPASSLEDSDWKVVPAAGYTAPNFTDLASAPSVGNPSSPAKLSLDPHWQFLKFLYFDRKLAKKLSICPVFIEAYPDKGAAAGDPPIRSNWWTHPEACQAIPWIIRKPAAKPDKDVLIQFQTDPATFIKTADDGSRAMESGTPHDTPGPDRMRYYDLPLIWKSTQYYSYLSGGKDKAPAKKGFFESLAAEATSDAKPLMFSLDDMVLTDAGGTAIAWKADTDRAAVYSHTFREGTNLSKHGMYRPDASPFSFFTTRDTGLGAVNYIADYPDWTRLVVANGNLHEAFDQRVPGAAGAAVGARAAKCWVDAAKAPDYTAVGTHAPTGNLKLQNFMAVQPFHRQEHSHRSGPYGIGRYDVALLRCCGLEGDVETAICIQYFRYSFNFNSPIAPSFNKHFAAFNPAPKTPDRWAEEAVTNIANRWNGLDAPYSTKAPFIMPERPADMKIKVRVFWIVHALPAAVSHYEIGVFKLNPANSPESKIRAYMGSFDGRGVLDQIDQTLWVAMGTGWFTAAHESGHASSLGDEYIEHSTVCSYDMKGIQLNSPGDPYAQDTDAMMNNNVRMRARYFWHLAEWMHGFLGKDFVVSMGEDAAAKKFSIPAYTPANPLRCHVNWPLAEKRKYENGKAHCDLFMYALGKDDYHNDYVFGKQFDGIIIIIVKLRIKFHNRNHADIQAALLALDKYVADNFNRKFKAAGTAGGKAFAACQLYFSPRFLVETLSTDATFIALNNNTGKPDASFTQADFTAKVDGIETANNGVHALVKLTSAGGTAWSAGAALPADPEKKYNPHFLTFRIDDGNADTEFPKRFAEMIDVAPGALGTPASYVNLVKQVIPDAAVSAI